MGYQVVNFKNEDNVSVIQLVTAVDSQDEVILLSQEISECSQKFRMNHDNSVLVITEAVPGLFGKRDRIESIRRELPGYIPISESIGECEKPVIIGILGDVVDWGLEIALACDVRVASGTSRFGFRQVKSRLMPWDGGTQRLSRTVGKAKALEMILTGELINAQEAHRIGLVNRLVSAEEVVPTVMTLAKDMASKSSVSMEYCKEAIIKGMDLTLDQGLRLEADLYFLMHTTHDRKEGIKAFQEKRKAEFKGN